MNLKIGEAVVAAEQEVVAEKQNRGGVGQSLRENRKYTPRMRERNARYPNT